MYQFSFFFRIFANRNREPFRFDRDTHQITSKTEKSSLANGGPHQLHQQLAARPVDYNDGERSNLLTKEFSSHHRAATLFSYY